MRLVAISAEGSPAGYDGELTADVSDVLQHTVALYSRVGFEVPWISYLAVEGSRAVGICSFKSRPVKGRVEIGYFTFPECEGRGIATAMASQLIEMSEAQSEVSCVVAQTLQGRNASHRILEKLGFRVIDTVEHPEDGLVLEWQLMRRGAG